MAAVVAASRRLTAAIAAGGELAPLVAALETYECRWADLETRLATVRAPRPIVDRQALRRNLSGYLDDWQGLLRGHVPQAQQILRRLVVGRLTFTPQSGGGYAFTGKGTVRPLLAGVVRKLASPSGTVPLRTLGLAFAGVVAA